MNNFELSTQQLDFYGSSGYLLLENVLPGSLLDRWRQIADQLDDLAMTEHAAGIQGRHYCVVEDPVGPRLMRFDDVCSIDPDAALDLLACPAMMAVCQQICGPGTVPMQMDILYKQQHPHPVINWHQGAQHSRTHPYLNIGIYLDDAPAGDGCLRYVPGTQHQLQNIQDLSQKHGWEIPGVIEQPASAGDILVQDMMILHGSQPKRSSGTRRTIYVELRPFADILESSKQSKYWTELRKQWMALVLERAADAPLEWFGEAPPAQIDQQTLFREIAKNPEPPIPAVWATFPVEHPEYPVPADLR